MRLIFVLARVLQCVNTIEEKQEVPDSPEFTERVPPASIGRTQSVSSESSDSSSSSVQTNVGDDGSDAS